jgi:thioester reductase-like protein
MSEPTPDLSRLSPEEKRALLAKMLRDRASGQPNPAQFLDAARTVRERSAAGPGIVGRDLSGPELLAEAALDPAIVPEAPADDAWRNPRHVLLTGATGFLGAFILRELLTQTEAVVHCLVRAKTADEGRQRLRQSLVERELWNGAFAERIVPLVGDLSRPRLGLTEHDLERLADQLDAIYHSGALVQFLARYTALKPTNVGGTVELLRLACRRRTKALHLVSSISVVPILSYVDAGVLPELDDLDTSQPVQGGYLQTKWASEKLVHAARDRGLPVTVHRPGMISGDSRTGCCNLDDMFCRVIANCVQTKLAPAFDIRFDLVPVDYVAAALVHLSRQPSSLGHAFYLINQQQLTWAELLGVIRSQGYPVQEVPYALWQKFLASQPALAAEQNPLALLAPLFPVAPDQLPESVPRMTCDDSRTQAGLVGSGIHCPAVDTALQKKYVSYLARRGLLPKPARNGA